MSCADRENHRFNSSDQATIGASFVIPKGTTKTVLVGANMNDDLTLQAGEIPQFAVIGVNTSSTIIGALPIVGATHTINSSLSIGGVTMSRGALDPGSNLTKEIGTTDYNFSSIKITAGSAEDIIFKSIRWYQSESASATDVENLRTVVDSVEYEAISDGRYFVSTFLGNGITIAKGFSKDVTFRGDIVSGSDRSIDFDIDHRNDLNLTGARFGYGIMPPFATSPISADSSNFSDTNNPYYDASQVLVSSGTLSVSPWTAVQAQNIGANIANQEFGGLTIEVRGEPINVGSIAITLTLTEDSESDLGLEDVTNITLVSEDGFVIAGPNDGSGTDTTGTMNLWFSLSAQLILLLKEN